MKYWNEGKSENGYGENGIILKGGDKHILSVVKKENGIQFMEECDGYYSHVYTKQQAVEMLIELTTWIEGEQVAVCDVCGSNDIVEVLHMGKNCNTCHPL